MNISPFGFLLNVIIVSFLAYILGLIYLKFGRSLSNRASLATNFPLLSLATMAIITVVKSSLALSLGLVGALSIVRFRTPIKEPEELIYLFLCIALGLAVGADQRVIAILIIVSTLSLLYITRRSRLTKKSMDGSFTIFINSEEIVDEEKIINAITNHSESVTLKRFNGKADSSDIEICLDIVLNSFTDIINLKKSLYEISSKMNIEIIDSNKVLGGN